MRKVRVRPECAKPGTLSISRFRIMHSAALPAMNHRRHFMTVPQRWAFLANQVSGRNAAVLVSEAPSRSPKPRETLRGLENQFGRHGRPHPALVLPQPQGRQSLTHQRKPAWIFCPKEKPFVPFSTRKREMSLLVLPVRA